ncbi:MAG: hypothetical protein A2474_05490 [Elusimicrobia bacterium RIFOXYC2_FULL_34_12]|nr:MAG: hypothetical protein A2474_05490 [Elusimicrobia bacterium RIFOXYC2_FULL_34_12]OGS39321.1 MAG: hypothetical protein A2551_07525 [Elusimicrobia bacterium RIFOXYD2_FULL_34_30]
MPKIIVKFGAAVIKEMPVDKDVITIGRKEDNDISIDNPAVSGHHAKIFKQGDGYFLEDLNSTNGTFLNETKVLKAGIHNKDQVGLAKHTLIFINEEESAAPQKPSEQKSMGGSETVIIDATKLREMLNDQPKVQGQGEKVGFLKIIEGCVDQNTEIEIAGLLVYIGTGEQAQIKIKGMFAPSVAAAISHKPEGYTLKAVKEGYPKVNGDAINDIRQLHDGDMLEFGKTKMVFLLKQK